MQYFICGVLITFFSILRNDHFFCFGEFENSDESHEGITKYNGKKRSGRKIPPWLSRHIKNDTAYNRFDGVNKLAVHSKEPEITTLPVHTRYPHATNVNYSFYRIHDRININKKAKPKYYFSIISMFKNERGIMKEWLDHHIGHGVDHFYLIDDGSTDGIMDVLDTYVKNGERDKICICNFI